MGRVTARVPRVRLDTSTGTVRDRPDAVAVEEPLEIRVGGVALATTMRTPGDDFDLAIGHLVTEGLVADGRAVAQLMHCTDVGEDGLPTYNVVDVTLAPGVSLLAPPRARAETMTSACGVCGSATIDDVRTRSRYAVADDPLALSPELVVGLPDALATHQATFVKTGGVHAAGVFDGDGTALAVREDVGRHNAVDKVIGAVVRDRALPLAGHVLVVSARASFEIVQKASVVGIPVVVAVGAATSLAVELARDCGITLVAFTRAPTMSIYSGAHRLR